MKTIRLLAGLAALLFASTALAQLKPFTDYEPSKQVTHVTTIRVHANMIEDYLEGIRETWVASQKVAKELGHIKGYSVWVSEMPNSGEFNVLLVVDFASSADMEPSKERYEAFMKAWGAANEQKVRERVKDYPSMREITGEYSLREITFK